MKSLFFVSVAFGIFSGTSISAKAQTSVSQQQLTLRKTFKFQPQFIEGIEINSSTPEPEISVKLTPAALSNKALQKDEPASLNGVRGIKHSGFKQTAAIEECTSLQFKYAQILDVEVEEVSNFLLYNTIDDWWATRYRYGGTTKRGIDCSAYTGELLRAAFNINPPRTARAQYQVCKKINRENLQEGDLVFFNTRGGVSHVGMYLGNNYFTHSSTSSGVTISCLNDTYYSRKFICGGRMDMVNQEANAIAE